MSGPGPSRFVERRRGVPAKGHPVAGSPRGVLADRVPEGARIDVLPEFADRRPVEHPHVREGQRRFARRSRGQSSDFASPTVRAVVLAAVRAPGCLVPCGIRAEERDLLGGLDRPTEGTIELGGTDLGAQAETELTRLRAQLIGFIFQTFNLIPTLSAAENVGAALIRLGIGGAGRRARVAAALDAVGLADRAGRHPGNARPARHAAQTRKTNARARITLATSRHPYLDRREEQRDAPTPLGAKDTQPEPGTRKTAKAKWHLEQRRSKARKARIGA
jgi:hypothetical protein